MFSDLGLLFIYARFDGLRLLVRSLCYTKFNMAKSWKFVACPEIIKMWQYFFSVASLVVAKGQR